MSIGKTNAGGGVQLGCKVIGSLTEPANPKGNTIWVKTNIAITKTNIQPTTPSGDTNTVTGVVWIQDNASTWVSPNFSFTNSTKIHMRCFPGKTYQYNGSKWVKKDAYIRQSNKWVQISAEFSATITVTYPSGSTLTCSNGSTTLTATTTTGSYTFTVPSSGTWTIKAVSGSQSASKTVSITSDGQSASVTLSFTLYLYNAGDQYTSTTGGWAGVKCGTSYANSGAHTINSNNITITLNAYSCWGLYTKNKVDITNYTKLVVEYSGTNISASDPKREFQMEVLNDLTTGEWSFKNRAASKATTSSGATSMTLDISSVSGSKYIAFEYGTSGSADTTGVKITKVYLSQ